MSQFVDWWNYLYVLLLIWWVPVIILFTNELNEQQQVVQGVIWGPLLCSKDAYSTMIYIGYNTINMDFFSSCWSKQLLFKISLKCPHIAMQLKRGWRILFSEQDTFHLPYVKIQNQNRSQYLHITKNFHKEAYRNIFAKLTMKPIDQSLLINELFVNQSINHISSKYIFWTYKSIYCPFVLYNEVFC